MNNPLRGYAKAKADANGWAYTFDTPFHKRIYDAAWAWMRGTLPDGKRNLAICIPPRHTKTALARTIVEFGLGFFPDSEWIYTSYTTTLAVDQTVKIRDMVNSEWYKGIFLPIGMNANEGRQEYFTTTAGGSVYGVGALGTITGFGAGKKRAAFGGAIIIDDPLNASDATSDTVREKVNNWFTGTLLSRRNAGSDTPMLLIAQRLHPHDLVGYLKETYPEEWSFMEIPVVEPGAETTIWPAVISYPEAMRLKEIDPFTFNAQYQQTPVPPGGGMIKQEWFKNYWTPAGLEQALRHQESVKIITADTAYGTKEANDYSVFQCWLLEGCEKAYLVDQIRGKWAYPDLLQAAVGFWTKHNDSNFPVYRMFIENKASGQSLVQQQDLFREKGINCHPWSGGNKDKASRVRECLGIIAGGRVLLPESIDDAPWADDFIAECCAFTETNSQLHDDQVDAMTMALLIWRSSLGGRSDDLEGL